MASGVRVVGLRKAIRSLEQMGVEAADLKDAFQKIGKMVSSEAHTLAPKLDGTLSASIRPSKTKNKAIVRAGGARIPYAGVIHYGGYNNITANPFLTRALERKQDQAVNEMEEALNDLIRRLDLN